MTASVRLCILLFLLASVSPRTLTQNSQTARSSDTLNNDDITGLLKAGISDEIVIAKIKVSKCEFDTSPTALAALKSQNVSDSVILAMVQAPRVNAPKEQTGSPEATDSVTTSEPPAASSIRQENVQPSALAEDGQTCDKAVSFALADASGVHPFLGTGNWIAKWIQKNAKKYPEICFSQAPMQGRKNYLVALSQSAGYLTGFDPVVRTNTSTSTSPVSGSGTVTDNYGGMWNYTYNGAVTTTATTTTNENVPYTINSNAVFANAYDENGNIVSRHYYVYSAKSGGEPANSLGYNMGNALAAINARGRLLSAVANDIQGKTK